MLLRYCPYCFGTAPQQGSGSRNLVPLAQFHRNVAWFLHGVSGTPSEARNF